MEIDCHAFYRPMPGEAQSGDITVVKPYGGYTFLGLVDVAGHGPKAHELAVFCEQYLQAHINEDLSGLLQELHLEIHNSRGAVAGLALLHNDTGNLKYCGIGNIFARTVGCSGRSLSSHSGLIGQVMPVPREEHTQLSPGDALILCSDGLSSLAVGDFLLEPVQGAAKSIATLLIERCGKATDDASCIVLRFGANT